jgi:hypothetical protein
MLAAVWLWVEWWSLEPWEAQESGCRGIERAKRPWARIDGAGDGQGELEFTEHGNI